MYLTNSFQYNKSIKHWAPFPVLTSTCSFTVFSDQSSRHMTYALILSFYRGKFEIQKQNKIVTHCIGAHSLLKSFKYFKCMFLVFSFLSWTFAFVETATDFNERQYSSKVYAPIPQRFNWTALYTSLVS